jgi:3-oxoacyl-[acyl-carrier protein] reductase
MSQFEDRIAIITGAARGIGKTVALDLAKGGATIVVADVMDMAAIEETAQEIINAGGKAMPFQVNVTDADQVAAMVKATTSEYGKIDILVNNAGITRDNLIIKMKPEDFDLVINVNLKGAWLCSKAAVRPMMKKRYGRIINMASISGEMGQAGQTNYSASKAGLIGMTKSLAREVGMRNITVNAVAPGFIKTAMTENLPEDIVAGLMSIIPLGRMGEVEDISNAVKFLAKEESAYITGQVISVNGGMAM